MDFKTYFQEAKRTMNSSLSHEMQLANAALGLCGEVGETLELITTTCPDVTDASVINELGDICWYIAWLMELLQIEQLDALMTPPDDDIDVAIVAAKVADHIKKTACHGYPMTSVIKADITRNLSALHNWVTEATYFCETTIYDVYDANIDKLKKRFKTDQGFTREESMSREDGL